MILELDAVVIGLFAVVCVLVVGGCLVSVFEKLKWFRRELRYICMEIERTDGSESLYWQRKKRELWLSLLPFYRKKRR